MSLRITFIDTEPETAAHLRLLHTPETDSTAMSCGYTTRPPERFSPGLVERVVWR